MQKIPTNLDERTLLIRRLSFEKKTLDPEKYCDRAHETLYSKVISRRKAPIRLTRLLARAMEKLRHG